MIWSRFRHRTRRPLPRWDLDTAVLSLSPTDHVSLGEMYCGTQIWGSTGSGKSSGSMAALCRAMFSPEIRAGSLCLCAKREDRALYEKYAREAGRQDDVMVFGPDDSSLRYNFIDAELAGNAGGAGLVEGMTSLVLTAGEVLDRNGTARGGGENEAYFRKAAAQLLRNCLEVLVLAYGTVTLSDLQKLIAHSPVGLEQVASPSWQQQSFYFQVIRRAERTAKSPSKQKDFELAVSFLLSEWPGLSSRTRSVVQSTLSGTLDVLSRGTARDLLSSPITNVRPEDTWNGAIVIVDIPVLIYHEVAQLIAVIMKTCWQRAALRRDVAANPRAVCIISDESHLTTVNADWAFQVVARSTHTAVIAATQGLTNYLETFGPSAEPAVLAMLANRQLHIHHQQNDPRTISFAQEQIGRRKQYLFNGSGSQNDDWLSPLLGGGERQASAGFAETWEMELQAGDFHGLRKGGPPRFEVDAIVIQGGKRFNATGRTWMPAMFRQRF